MRKIFENVSQYISDQNPVPGLAIVIQDNFGCENFSSGYFSDNDDKRIDEHTIYDLASITKLYTALVILELHECKKLNINDLCSKYISIFSESQLKIIDLLAQKANFNIRLAPYREKYGEKLKENIFKIQPPVSCSDGTFYENITYIYLGKIIETILNKSLSDVFNDLFIRYGLEETHLGIMNQKKFISPPTEKFDNKLVQNFTHDETARLLGGVSGNAGIFASTMDLAKFGKIWLKNETLKQLALKNYSAEGQLPQGLGWWNRVQNIKYSVPDVFSHTGYTGGIIMIHIPSATVCAMLTNRTYYGRDNRKHEKIWALMLEEINKT